MEKTRADEVVEVVVELEEALEELDAAAVEVVEGLLDVAAAVAAKVEEVEDTVEDCLAELDIVTVVDVELLLLVVEEIDTVLELAEPIFLKMLRRLLPPQISHRFPVQSMLHWEALAGTDPACKTAPQ